MLDWTDGMLCFVIQDEDYGFRPSKNLYTTIIDWTLCRPSGGALSGGITFRERLAGLRDSIFGAAAAPAVDPQGTLTSPSTDGTGGLLRNPTTPFSQTGGLLIRDTCVGERLCVRKDVVLSRIAGAALHLSS